ncbi:hypothetical protein [Caloramator sp. ALD01]|uniref:hypothetical protein n=1 Tax=Caloramator sp. ALD01 TaxID=1031288 RepID=UPI000416C22B|nr:hypothetical protein [Caloramator sp. ALD01]
MKNKVCSLLILLMFINIVSCTGFKKLSKIKALDYFSGINCEIPLEIPYASPTSEYLHTNDDMKTIKNKLDLISKQTNNFNVEMISNDSLMIIYNKNSQNALYVLYEYTAEDIGKNISITMYFQIFHQEYL